MKEYLIHIFEKKQTQITETADSPKHTITTLSVQKKSPKEEKIMVRLYPHDLSSRIGNLVYFCSNNKDI